MHSVLGVIPARLHSTRFPRKVLAPILGKPMVQWVWENAQKAWDWKALVIATDSEEVQKVCRSFGADCYVTPDQPSGTDRVAYVARELSGDIVVNLQGDEPLLESSAIRKLVEEMQHLEPGTMGTMAVPLRDPEGLFSPDVVKVVHSTSGKVLYFSRSPLRTSAQGTYLKHLGIYAFFRKDLFDFCGWEPSMLEKGERLEQLRALENNMAIQLVTVEQDSIAVDRLEHLALVEKRLRNGS